MWWTIAWILVSVAGAWLAAASVKSTAPTPATMDDFNIATATENRPIPVVFGTRIVSPNHTLYGKLRVDAVHD